MHHALAHEALFQEGSYARHHPKRPSSVGYRRLRHGKRFQVPDKVAQITAFCAAK